MTDKKKCREPIAAPEDRLEIHEQRELIGAALYHALRKAAREVFKQGVEYGGAVYGVTTPDLIRACQLIAFEEHADLHQSIAECLRDGDEDEDGTCDVCEMPLMTDTPVRKRGRGPYKGAMGWPEADPVVGRIYSHMQIIDVGEEQ